MKIYAGIGSRETPDHIAELMYEIAWKMADLGWVLRSGGAPGADRAFQRGCEAYHIANKISNYNQEIFLPWEGFNGLHVNADTGHLIPYNSEAASIAETYHPRYKTLSRNAKLLMNRNSCQILGVDLKTPVKFVVCWTPDASLGKTSKDTGGTGQALRIAFAYGIPIYNLGNPSHLSKISDWVYN